ncbi:MAG: DegV family EDD domain-containing protein [Deltaproteobacteria bacterium]|nr:DegV family EDD domain-containing protein [Deltaproteobacteria bacterium]
MLIVTNPGSNLSETIIERYGIAITPQQVVVDGVSHDTREGVSQADVDRWVASAKIHPHTLGTSAAEFVAFFRQVADSSREILAVHTSRKIIQSHDACLAAAKTLRELGRDPLEIEVVDSTVTDGGAGMVTLFAATAAQSGASLRNVAEWTRAFAARGRFAIIPESLDWTVKGGRTSFARAWLANLLKLRPLLTMEQGEATVAAKVRIDADRSLAIADWLESEIGAGRPVYAAVNHGDVRAEASVLMRELDKRFDIRTRVIRPIGPAVYLHTGHGTLAAYVAPIDGLPFEAPSLGDIA